MLSDRWVVVAAIAAFIGALVPLPVPWLAAATAVAVALVWERPRLLIVSLFVLTAALAVESPQPTVIATGEIEATYEVVADGVRWGGGGRTELERDGVRYEASGWGAAGARLRDRLVGQTVVVVGQVRPSTGSRWHEWRDIDATVSVEQVVSWSPASGLAGIANQIRGTLDSGASSLSIDDKALFLGIVIGDDREMSMLVEDDFRAAGLTHLVAVSGQNVAFVLIVVGPLLRRLDYRSRWLALLGVLLLFGVITRFEPSVVRATAMAAVAASATALGRETSALRTLSLAVVAALLWQPALAHSLGFRLSLAATAGILFLSPWLISVLPGPRIFREASGVTIGAQVAVAPMLVATFGSIPVASLPANLLVGPVAGPVMLWGLTAGPLAGLLGGVFAEVAHRPTSWGTGWMRYVAQQAAVAPFGQLTVAHLIAGSVAVGGALVVGKRRLAGAVALVILSLPSLVFVRTQPGRVEPETGLAITWSGEVAVEIDEQASLRVLLPALRLNGIRQIDVLIIHGNADRIDDVAGLVGARHAISVLVTDG